MYSASLAYALYPKILSNSYQNEQVSSSFRSVMMFAIPFAAIIMGDVYLIFNCAKCGLQRSLAGPNCVDH